METIKKATTGGLIKEVIELDKYRNELMKELNKREKTSLPVAKRLIKKLKGENNGQ